MGTRRYCFRSDDQVLSVAAVEIDPGDLALHAHREIAAPAWVANKTMTAMPADSDWLTLRPWHDIASDRVDATGNFMTRHTWILNARPQTVLHQDIAVANATRLHFHANLSRARLRNFAFHQFKIPAGFADLRRLHFHNASCPSRLLSWLLRIQPPEIGRIISHCLRTRGAYSYSRISSNRRTESPRRHRLPR